MSLTVTNPTDVTVHMRSFDGNSVAIHARARAVQVADKFVWQYPSSLIVVQGEVDRVDPTNHVRGSVPEPVVVPRGWHNRGRAEPLMTAAQMRERVARKRDEREAKLAAAGQAKPAASVRGEFGSGPAPSQVAASAEPAKADVPSS